MITDQSHCKWTEPEKTIRNDRSLTVMNKTDETVVREINCVYWNSI